MEKRLAIPCPVELKKQTDFSEPKKRINTDNLDVAALEWSEENAWDEIAEFYRLKV